MFWTKKTLESAEYLKLFKLVEENRIKLEMLSLELDLTKVKLRSKKGIEKTKEYLEEQNESNKNPNVFLNPNGDIIGA